MRHLLLVIAVLAIGLMSGCSKKSTSPTSPSTGSANGSIVVFDHWGTITVDTYGHGWSHGYVTNTGSAAAHNARGNSVAVDAYTIEPGAGSMWTQSAIGSSGGFNNPASHVITWNEQ